MKKILILTANPRDTDRLSLDEEVREIEAGLRRSRHRDQFELIAQWAVRPDELRRALLDHEPQIVHFSGHGAGEHGLVLANDAGGMQFVSTEALTGLFKALEPHGIECVLLNACYSEVQATAIHQSVDCVIGMNQPIGDRAAIEFAEGFYDALGAGSAYDQAFEIGCSAIALEGSAEYTKPVLKYRRRRDPEVSRAPLQPERGATEIADPPVRPSQSQTIGTISISGSHNPFNVVQAGGDVNLSQTSDQSSGGNADLEAALDLLAKLRQEVAATADLSAFAKKDTESKIGMLQEELQKPEPDKGFVNEVVQALQQGLSGVLTLAEPVTKVAALLAKAWVGLP